MKNNTYFKNRKKIEKKLDKKSDSIVDLINSTLTEASKWFVGGNLKEEVSSKMFTISLLPSQPMSTLEQSSEPMLAAAYLYAAQTAGNGGSVI